jgi:hypothetical protein
MYTNRDAYIYILKEVHTEVMAALFKIAQTGAAQSEWCIHAI